LVILHFLQVFLTRLDRITHIQDDITHDGLKYYVLLQSKLTI